MGELELAFRQLHAKLAREGLFDPARKRPIPRWVRRVAVVTSPTGAAIHDFLNVLRRRRRDLEVVIVPVKVQGAGAAEEIADAIDRVNRISEEAALSIEKTVSMEHAMPAEYLPQHGHGAEACTKADGMAKRSAQPFDVLVVTRGGGSLDDLWSFNEECVVRAIARSRLPVISGVGHEIDVTLTDLAADLRALTPSEAAERVAPSADELEKMMRQLGLRLGTALRHRVHLLRRQFDDLASRSCFRDPLRNIRERTRQLDELDGRMTRAVRNRLEMANRDLGTLAARLQSISPLAVLGRGYSLTMTRDGSIVRNVADVTIGMILTTRLNGGVIESRAERIWETSPSQE
ncbi:MAG: exodeoxyribonuclease VII large subunit [Thermoguttaceae bacterium]|nr:exodeoxyribonuclease VII large subunit [Thermoguttaceae bacterium]